MALSEEHKRTLSLLASIVIPPSDEYGVPGGGDEAICTAIIGDAGRRQPELVAALSAIEDLARADHGSGFADLTPEQRETVARAFREKHPASASLVEGLTTQC